ncbi:MAG: hypothetical protein WBD07_10330 [Vicinamibacterales bacterium]
MSALFDASYLRPISMDQVVKLQYGASAHALAKTDHLHGWVARVGTEEKSINLATAYPSTGMLTLVAKGVRSGDWAAANLKGLSHVVFPVMVIAKDFAGDLGSVNRGLDYFRSNLAYVRKFYLGRVGRTFKLLQPVVAISSKSASDLNRLCDITTNDAHRNDFFYGLQSEYTSGLIACRADLLVVCAPFTGSSSSHWNGAAGLPGFAAVPPDTTSLQCPESGPVDAATKRATYGMAHEMGHAFDLDHTTIAFPLDPKRRESVMETKHPPEAILVPGEVTKLKASPFFTDMA